jgi:hypothetical protein
MRYNKTMKRGTRKRLISWLIYLGTVIFWSIFWLMFFFVTPINYWRIAGLMASLFFSLGLTFYLLSKNLRWSGIASFYLTGLLFLQLIRQLHLLNAVLFSAFCLAVVYHQNRT